MLLVSVGVLATLLARAEGRDFHLPGGDGTIVMLAGAWVAIADLLPPVRQARASGQRTDRLLGRRAVGHLRRPARRARARLRRPADALRRTRRATAVAREAARRRRLAPCSRAAATVVVPPTRTSRHARDRARARDAERAERRCRRGAGAEAPTVPGSEAPTVPTAPSTPAGERRSRRDRPRYPPPPSEQMSFEDAPRDGPSLAERPQRPLRRVTCGGAPRPPRLSLSAIDALARAEHRRRTSRTGCAPSATCPASRPRWSSYLATKLGKPVLVEGPAGVGKTELAKALASYLGRELVRLQCYEGLDEAKALYEWNYRKQLLRIQAEAGGAGWAEVQDDIFGEEFLLARPLMTAIASEQPGRAADRRDRQDRPGVRGDAARAALGLPDHDPRARPHRGDARSRSCC